MVSFVFGAGASFGSGRCTPKSPPLGKDLFDDLVELRGAFYKLDDISKRIFKSDGFEAGMATVADDSRIINPLQKELACYLSGFSVNPDNAYVRLINKLKKHINNINIFTLNYDLLIEQALGFHGLRVDYSGSGRGVNLLKPHGSSNFLPQLPVGMVLSGNTMIGCGTFVEGLETKAVFDKQEVVEWCNDARNSDLSPVLAMYAKSKRVVINSNLIRSTQSRFAELIGSSGLIVLIGIEYVEHDTHIWDPIQSRKPKLLIVNPYPKSTINWAKKNNIQILSVIEKSFHESVWSITKSVHAEIA